MKKILFLFFFITNLIYAQYEQNLKNYVTINNFYDYGYGLEKYDLPLDSVFDYRDFISKQIFFLKLEIKKYKFKYKNIRFEVKQKNELINRIVISNTMSFP